MKGQVAALVMALQFMTRLPVPGGHLYSPEAMAASVRYYPLAGLVIGMLAAAVLVAAALVFPPVVATLLAIVTAWLLTGGLHEDGLADTFDGLGAGRSRERALEIMRDSRLGAYGAMALMASLSFKLVTLSSLDVPLAAAALAMAHCLSRLGVVIAMATSRYARAEGAAAPVAAGPSGPGLVVASVTGLVVLGLFGSWAAWSLAAAGLVGAGIGLLGIKVLAERRLGGYTGDTLGAVQQASEVGVLLGVLAVAGA